MDVDMLSKINQSAWSYMLQIAKIQEITTASIDEIQFNLIKNQNDEWMDDLTDFLVNQKFFNDEERIRKFKLRAPRHEISGGGGEALQVIIWRTPSPMC